MDTFCFVNYQPAIARMKRTRWAFSFTRLATNTRHGLSQNRPQDRQKPLPFRIIDK